MKIVCDCGNESNFTEINIDDWMEIDKPRKGYIPTNQDYRRFGIDSQYEYCYITCEKCKKKIAIST